MKYNRETLHKDKKKELKILLSYILLLFSFSTHYKQRGILSSPTICLLIFIHLFKTKKFHLNVVFYGSFSGIIHFITRLTVAVPLPRLERPFPPL